MKRRKVPLYPRHALGRALLIPALAVMLLGGLSCLEVKPPASSPLDTTIGIDVDFVNGSLSNFITGGAPGATLAVAANRTFHINQLRFSVQVLDYPAPDVQKWLQEQTEFNLLDWSEIEDVGKWEEQDTRTFTWSVSTGLQGAKWMRNQLTNSRTTFTLSFLDDKGTSVVGPFQYRPEDFVINRAVAIIRGSGMPTPSDLGVGVSSYKTISVQSSGSFGGPKDDIYIVRVSKAGKMTGDPATGAAVTITSLRGDNNEKPINLTSGMELALGKAGHGAKIIFNEDAAAPTEGLAMNDKWIVRCATKGRMVKQVEPAIKAVMQGSAEFRFATALRNAPTFQIPSNVKTIQLTWSDNPTVKYTGAVEVVPTPVFDYGMKGTIKRSEPANGQFYVPKEKVKVSFEIFDQSDKSLLVKNKDAVTGKDIYLLQSYDNFKKKGDCKGASLESPGMMYYGSQPVPSGEGFFNEARTNLTYITVAGPRHLISQDFRATRPAGMKPDGWFFTNKQLPPNSDATGGAAPGSTLWLKPISPDYEFELPAEVKPGTYTIYIKIQRSYLGQRIYRLFQQDFQVGQSERTEYSQTTGNCGACHAGEASLLRLRHFDREEFACVVCHNRPQGTAAEIVHAIHFHSPLYLQDKNDCSLCHIVPGSNTRTTRAICGCCHEAIHPDRPPMGDEYDECGSVCHRMEPAGHIPMPPL